jgi:hypothetical protein
MSQSELNLLTFIVAAVGAFTGVASLAWNVVPYISSGAKIRVELSYIGEIQKEGGVRRVFEISAYNKRRGPIQIRQCGIQMYPSGSRKPYTTFFAQQRDSDDEIPKTVQGGHGARWRIYANELSVYEENKLRKVKLGAIVQLGNGKDKKSRPLRLAQGALHAGFTLVPDDLDISKT